MWVPRVPSSEPVRSSPRPPSTGSEDGTRGTQSSGDRRTGMSPATPLHYLPVQPPFELLSPEDRAPPTLPCDFRTSSRRWWRRGRTVAARWSRQAPRPRRLRAGFPGLSTGPRPTRESWSRSPRTIPEPLTERTHWQSVTRSGRPERSPCRGRNEPNGGLRV